MLAPVPLIFIFLFINLQKDNTIAYSGCGGRDISIGHSDPVRQILSSFQGFSNAPSTSTSAKDALVSKGWGEERGLGSETGAGTEPPGVAE